MELHPGSGGTSACSLSRPKHRSCEERVCEIDRKVRGISYSSLARVDTRDRAVHADGVKAVVNIWFTNGGFKNSELETQLRRWGPKFDPSKIERIVASTRDTSGIPMDSYEMLWIKDLASQAIEANRKVVRCSKGIEEVLSKDAFWCKYIEAVGAGTLGVLLTTVGDPRNYPNGGSLLKALGLNLKERSSGARIGERAITKRGSASTTLVVLLGAASSAETRFEGVVLSIPCVGAW